MWTAIISGVVGAIAGTAWAVVSGKKEIKKNFKKWFEDNRKKEIYGEKINWDEALESFLKNKKNKKE